MKGIESSELPRVQCDDPGAFLRTIVPLRQPVVITGLVSRWPAAELWSPEYFKEKYGDNRCQVLTKIPSRGASYGYLADDFTREMSLAEFVDYMRSTQDICYYRRQHAEKTCGILKDLGFDQLTPGMPSTDFLWIGSANTRTGLHFDLQDNVLCQLYGDKEVYLVSPQDSRYLHAYPDSVTKSPIETDFPDDQKYPGIRKAKWMYTVLQAGEALYIPKLWWHSVRSLSVSISVSHEFGLKVTWPEVARAVSAVGMSSWFVVVRDFLRHGLLQIPVKCRLGDDPPFGRLVYEMLQSAIRRRLHS